MAEEGSKLQRMDGEMLDEGLPEEPKEDSPQSLQCKEIIAEMKIEHDKYNKIVRKIVTGTNRLFLVKCKVEKGEYYFLAEYLNDNFEKDFFGNSMAFSASQQCRDKTSKINREDEINRLNGEYGKNGGPMLEFKFLHNDKRVTIKIGAPNKRTISYEDFKNSFIPIDEAFMYKNMPKTIDETNIVGMKLLEPQSPPPPVPGTPPMPPPPPEMDEAQVVDLTEEEEKEFSDASDGEEKVGGRKKRRKKRSRSKKRRRRRKNRTKKN